MKNNINHRVLTEKEFLSELSVFSVFSVVK